MVIKTIILEKVQEMVEIEEAKHKMSKMISMISGQNQSLNMIPLETLLIMMKKKIQNQAVQERNQNIITMTITEAKYQLDIGKQAVGPM